MNSIQTYSNVWQLGGTGYPTSFIQKVQLVRIYNEPINPSCVVYSTVTIISIRCILVLFEFLFFEEVAD